MPIELRKKGEKVYLRKSKENMMGIVQVNLNWNKNRPNKNGLLSKIFTIRSAVDLDLGCLYELNDGTKGVVQALGTFFGELNSKPYIFLDGDDRTGDSVEGENLFINGNFIKEIKRILVYGFIYEGSANWAQADAVINVKSEQDDLIIRLDDYDTKSMVCAIAYINNDGIDISVEKLLKFYLGHKEMSEDYNWGINWHLDDIKK